MSQLVLIAEDEIEIADILGAYLRQEGFRTAHAADGETAAEMHATLKPDLVLLDVRMPGRDGWDVLGELRRRGETPVIMITALDQDIDKLQALRIGADDYVVKPFSPREVVARVAAILRRVNMSPPPPPPGAVRVGRLSLDTDGWRARWNDADVPLTITEFGIVRALASAPQKVFTRDAIIDRIHGPGFALTDRTIDSHVRNLRAKFASIGGADVIETRAGVGYQMGPCRGGEA